MRRKCKSNVSNCTRHDPNGRAARPDSFSEVIFLHLILVEDLAADRDRLAELIRQDCARHGETVDFSFYESGEEFLAHYRPLSCDGIFLDVLLGGVTGMEAARRIRQAEPRLPIVFTTEERDFAVEGFAVGATDYLVKPLGPEQVARCMGRLREYLAQPASLVIQETSGRGHSTPIQVELDAILYGQYFDHAMSVHTGQAVYRTRLSFQEFTARLPHSGRFHVCGRGLVVNLSQVQQVENDALLLRNGERLPFSRRRKQEIQTAYAQWKFARARKGRWAQ